MELETKTDVVTLTNSAFNQIKTIIAQQNKTELFLRVFVQGGGCSGLSFGMALDDRGVDSDQEYMINGLKVVIDKVSFPHVEGANIDFDESGEKSGFRITNPNSEAMSSQAAGCSSCGPGGC